MKKLNHFIFIACSIFCMGILDACSNDAETPTSIDIQDICGVYTPQQVKMTFNGEDMPALGNASLTMESLDNHSKDEMEGDYKILLALPPLWPNLATVSTSPVFDNVTLEVEASASPEEVVLEGMSKQPQHELVVKGVYKEGILNLDLTYSITSSMLVGKKFLFEFGRQSLDFDFLNPSLSSIEWKGSQIPVEEFVSDAITPVLDAIGRRLGGFLCAELVPEASVHLSIKPEGAGDVITVPGKHGLCNPNNGFAYFVTDQDGASCLTEKIMGSSFFKYNLFFSSINDYFYFVPVFYLKDVQDELKLAFDTPVNSFFYGLLFEWLENVGMTELSSEEMEKAYKLAHLLQDKTIRYIRLTGTAIE